MARITKNAEELKALRIANMLKAHAAFRAKAQARRDAEREGKTIPTKALRALVMDLAGYPHEEIVRIMRWKSTKTVRDTLKRPLLRAEREKIILAQRDALISGQFGVQAMAKAAAVEATQTLINQATNKVEVKPADARRAAVDVLKLSGDMVEKKISEHVHRMIRDFSTDELESWVNGRGVPDRVRQQFKLLGIEMPAAIDVTPRR